MQKEELVHKIKDWVRIENEMKMLQKELKSRREEKKKLTEDLVQVMKQHDIDCFDMKEGKILYTQNKIKAPLSKKHLMGCLQQYFEKHPSIDANEVIEYVLEKRDIKVKEGIRHKIDKTPQ
tara:strand:+ start:229 stop:591 length:363 start_codon:yes stop_codon:yes gene_type:complete